MLLKWMFPNCQFITHELNPCCPVNVSNSCTNLQLCTVAQDASKSVINRYILIQLIMSSFNKLENIREINQCSLQCNTKLRCHRGYLFIIYEICSIHFPEYTESNTNEADILIKHTIDTVSCTIIKHRE